MTKFTLSRLGTRTVGRYHVYDAFAAGGMASVHLGRMTGQAGFAKIVAVKQLHPSFAEDPATVSSVLDEARLASRIQHPNVVAMLDVVVEGPDILLVLEYVHGESLARLLRRSETQPPIAVANAILAAALHGLNAAHEATAEDGAPLGIVHRDVSPQNILVGIDGLGRVLDFGIAKARGRLQTTREGQVKGKLAYMAPEQIRLGEVSRRTDVFAAGVVLWEALTGARLFEGENEGQVMMKVLEHPIQPPSALRPEVSPAIDAIVLRALEREPEKRWPSARALALALEEVGPIAPASQVGAWVESVARDTLDERAARVSAIERTGLDKSAPRSAQADVVTRTETRGLSIEASPPEARTLPRSARVGLAAAVVVAVGASAALLLTRDVGPATQSSPGSPSPSISAPSIVASPAVDAPPAQPSASAALPEGASSATSPPAATAAPARVAAPSRPATPPSTVEPTPSPASSKPFYRFE